MRLWLLFSLLFTSVSAAVRRRVQVSVRAPWDSSIVCEAYNANPSWMQRLLDTPGQNLTQGIEQAKDSLTEVAVRMHMYAPLCQLQTRLAPRVPPQISVAVVGEEVPLLKSSESVLVLNERHELLPDEPVIGSGKAPVVLYTDFQSDSLLQVYQQLRQSETPMVLRYLGGKSQTASSLGLQGYGVRLDIRNVEYKVFDDRQDGPVTTNITESDWTAGVHSSVFPAEKLQEVDDLTSSTATRIPPVWQRRLLPLQLCRVVLDSPRPLETLEHLTGDLPSVASSLVHVSVDEQDSISRLAKELDQLRLPQAIFLNGRSFSAARPAWNVFEVLDGIQVESQKLNRLKEILPRFPEAWPLLKMAWMQASKFGSGQQKPLFRINVDGPSVFYLNDVEKDTQYEQWPTSLQQMLQGVRFGMPPSVRRNLFTLIVVLDWEAGTGLDRLDLAWQLVQNGYPVRVGLLIVEGNDMKECQTSANGQDCPVSSSWKESKDMLSEPVKSQVIHDFLFGVAKRYADEPGFIMGYCAELFMSDQPPQTIQALIDWHGNILSSMGLTTAKDAKKEALQLLKATSNYDKTLTHAVSKGIEPGMSFLNGRPVPEDVSQFFGSEQKYVFSLINKNIITDTSPSSVHAKILSGKGVFPQMHPLLVGQENYVLVDHNFDDKSLLMPSHDSRTPEARFCAEGFFDFTTDKGRSLLLATMKTLDKSEPKISEGGKNTDISMAFRLLPSNEEAAKHPLCPIMAHASFMGTMVLEDVLKVYSPSMTLEELLVIAEVHDDLQYQVKAYIEDSKNACQLSPYLQPGVSVVPKNALVMNGRVLTLENELTANDLGLLLELELPRSKAVTSMLKPFVKDMFDNVPVARAASFLANEGADSEARYVPGKQIEDLIETRGKDLDIIDNPLKLSWEGSNPDPNSLNVSCTPIEITVSVTNLPQVQVVAIFDPATEVGQRLSPLLRIIRDELGLPLIVYLTPAPSIDGDSNVPLTSFYRFVADWSVDASQTPLALFDNLPTNHLLTVRMDVPEPWDVQQAVAVQDSDNLRCDQQSGCGDGGEEGLTKVEYVLKSLLVAGQCYETKMTAPNGLQFALSQVASTENAVEVGMDGLIEDFSSPTGLEPYSDTLVMKNAGYWQLQANPGVWTLGIAKGSKGAEIFDFVEVDASYGRLRIKDIDNVSTSQKIVVKDFLNAPKLLAVKRRKGFEEASLFSDEASVSASSNDDEVIHVFSLATGHLYERFLKIMMLSVTRRTSSRVKFWLFENFLSPSFKATAKAMAERIGCEVEFVTYKWPEWLRGQSEKQRIIWGYKILFLDVLFPLNVKKIIYVDADQVVRGDLKELWDMDLQGAPYGKNLR